MAKQPTVGQNLYSGKDQFNPKDEIKSNEKKKTVIGIVEAEKLQKSGWQLLSAVPISSDPFGDKEYKFKKE